MNSQALHPESGSTPKRNWKKIGLILWLILFALMLAVHWYPIRFGTIRFALVAGVLLLWLGALWLSWNRKTVRGVLLACSLGVFIFALAPSRPTNPQALRQEYVQALQKYENTPYIWGGESKRGIDCSGLMRCALVDANIKKALTTFNPSSLRTGFSIWWHDSSARAMKEEYQDKTRFLFTSPSINQINYSAIEPGDIAVTSNGVHALAYIGDQTWIEADPSAVQGDTVIKVKTPTRNAWFTRPVHVMRWRQFEENSK